MTHPWKFRTKDNGNLLIRPVRREDAPDLHEIVRHPDVARMLLLHPAIELSETEEFVNSQAPGRHFLVAELDGRVAGSVMLCHMQRPRMKHMGVLGLYVGKPYWNLGIGGFLMQAALDIADNWLDLYRVELDVYTDNPFAIKLYEKFGFEEEARCRRVAFGPDGWRDNLLMARLRNVDLLMAQKAGKEPAPLPAAPARRREKVNFTIRAPHPDDAADMHAMFSHPLVSRTTLQLPSQTVEESRKRLQKHVPGLFRFMAEADGRAVGNITLHQSMQPGEQHAAGLGMMVHPDYWGVGIGSALMEAVLDIADNWAGFSRVELDVNLDNPAAIHLYEKYDFEIEGTRRFHAYGDGRWADSYLMARIRD